MSETQNSRNRIPWRRKVFHYAPKFALCFFVVGLCSLLAAPPAYADIGEMILDGIAGFFRSGAEWFFNAFADGIASFGQMAFISGSFTELFGSNWGTGQTVWGVINAVHSTLIVPLGESILALVMLVQVVKISGRIDATATLPAVKEIVFLAVVYVLLHWLITDSVDIMTAIFDEFNKITNGILDAQAADVGAITLPEDLDIGAAFGMCIIGLLMWLVSIVAAVIAWCVSAARAIQLYIYAAFSPIPLSLLGFEETRSMGVNFLKNFCAICLAGALLAFLFTIYPLVCSGTVSSLGSIQDGQDLILNTIVPGLGLPILFILGVTKSGGWARDLLGG